MDGTLALATVPIGQHFRITPAGLEVVGHPTLEHFATLGEVLRTFERAIQFAIGDYINAVEARYKEEASQLIDQSTGWSPSTVRAYAWTADKVAAERRMIDRGLSYAHHQAIAALPPRDQTRWLEKSLGKDGKAWPVSQLKAAVKAGGGQAETAWWVLVRATSAEHQEQLVDRFMREGLDAKAIARANN